MPISDADLWHQVHAQREDGVAAMFLIREIEPRVDQPQIFVVQMPYPVTDLSRLPDAAGYRRLDAFQERWIEPACEALGWTFVAWKSEDGSFFLYLYGGGDPNELLEKLAPFDDALGFFNDRDADWSEYAALRELVEQAESADDEDTNGAGHPHIHADEPDHHHGDHDHSDHDHHDHDHDDHNHAPVTDPVVKRPGRATRAATVRERPSNIRPAKKLVAKKPAAKTPAAKKSAAKKLAAKTPAAKTPAAKTPAAKTPAKTPAAKTPAAKTPAAKTPAAKTPAALTARNKPAPTRTPATKKPAPARSPAANKKSSTSRSAANKKPPATKTSAKQRSAIKSTKPTPRGQRR